jgi:ribosomal protein S18 acetylase RimI-like enzyme
LLHGSRRVSRRTTQTDLVGLNFDLRNMEIRAATNVDRDAIWNIFHEIVAAGDTYAFDPDMSRAEALAYWFRADTHAYVAEIQRQYVGEAVGFPRTATPSPTVGTHERVIAGTYILRPNQSGPGSHVANAAFMVASSAQGSGVGRAMAEHCLSEARRMGFRAMQFNFVVSTNTPAIHLWKQLGFEIVGTLPGAFRHPEKGYVDVYIMFRSLLA